MLSQILSLHLMQEVTAYIKGGKKERQTTVFAILVLWLVVCGGCVLKPGGD